MHLSFPLPPPTRDAHSRLHYHLLSCTWRISTLRGARDCGVLGVLEPRLRGNNSCRRSAWSRQQGPEAAARAKFFICQHSLRWRQRATLAATEFLVHVASFLGAQVEAHDIWVGVREVELEPERHPADAVPIGDMHCADQRDRDQNCGDQQGGNATIVVSRLSRHRER
eukprot:scaffold126789_cov69-Phaeocystis_antarctica.AAC.1